MFLIYQYQGKQNIGERTMFNFFLRVTITILLSLCLFTPDGVSITRKKAKELREKRKLEKKNSDWSMPEIKLLLIPRLTAGKLTSDAGDAVSTNDGGIDEKVYYGGGLGIQYWYRPSIIFGAGFDLIQKDLGHLNIDDPVKAKLITAEVAYRFPAAGKTSLILRLRGGSGSVSYDGNHIDNYFFKRFGLGICSFRSSGSLVTTFEFYYQSADTDGEIVSLFGFNQQATSSLTMIGFEIGLGIPILK